LLVTAACKRHSMRCTNLFAALNNSRTRRT
jgi:hypothetical protein